MIVDASRSEQSLQWYTASEMARIALFQLREFIVGGRRVGKALCGGHVDRELDREGDKTLVRLLAGLRQGLLRWNCLRGTFCAGYRWVAWLVGGSVERET